MEYLKSLGWDEFFENHLEPENSPAVARVIAEHKNAFIIKAKDGERRAVISGRFFHNAEKTADMPVVGDWVLVRDTDGDSVIQKVMPRKTVLARRAPTDRKTFGSDAEQIIVSNVDTVFIVTSLNQNFNLSRIERALALVYASGARPVILLSKSDLCDDSTQKINQVEQIAFGVPIIRFSNVTMQGMDEIKQMIEPGKTIVLLGSSGVGKTSLLNILASRAEKTIEIREKDGRGRHATVSRSLYILENGGMIIDVPGIREMGLSDGDSHLGQSYADIEDLISSCRFTNCSHQNAPGCAVLTAIENGALDERRFKNYLKIQKENLFQSDKLGARRAKTKKTKEIAKFTRQLKDKNEENN
ncbi:MAG: ribosome small subunit-dependent GTPase A [Alphaproteobacteria bacterium]|nr:ribosome small subunit-dependent GTPase A [Alphaproteobacteria bacterium]